MKFLKIIIFITLGGLIFIGGAFFIRAANDRGNEPVAYWKFDEGFGTTHYDDSTNRNDGTASGGVTWKNEAECKVGKCLSFNGTDGYVPVPHDASLNVTTAWTVSSWIYLRSTPSGYAAIATDAYPGAESIVQFVVAFENGTRKPWIGVYNGAWNTVSTTELVPLNQWVHLVGVYDGANTEVRGYVNGVSIGTGSAPSSVGSVTTEKKIGRRWDSPDFFDGLIDDVKIYDYARTVAQINADYQAGLAGQGVSRGTSVITSVSTQSKNHDITGMPTHTELSNGLIAHYKMNDNVSGDAKIITDSTGNNNGTTVDGANNTGMDCTVGGKFSYGCDFDGVDDYVSIGDISSSFGDEKATFCAWVKRKDHTPSTTGESGSWFFNTSSANNHYVWTDGLIYDGSFRTARVTVGAGDVSDRTQWHHVCITREGGTSGWKFYQNGSAILTTDGGTWQMATSVKIGESNSTAYNFDGLMDDVRLYNRVLSSSEIAMLALTTAPVAHYKFDEKTGTTTYDTSGSNDGTATNGPTWVSGYYGGALDFDGTDDYVDVGTLDVEPTYSVSAWVNFSAIPSAIDAAIVSNYNSGGSIAQYDLRWDSGNSAFQIFYQLSSGNYRRGYFVLTPNLNTWYHLAWTNSANTDAGQTLYINGVNRTLTFSNSGSPSVPTSGFGKTSIGRAGDFVSHYHEGVIDDVRIYNYARTQKQILEDMNAGHPAIGSPVGSYVGYWSFDEGFGSTANDKSIHVNNGTITVGGSGTNTTLAHMWDPSGYYGSALEFDGTDDYIDIANESNFDFERTDSFAFTVWIKVADISATNQIISKMDNVAPYRGYELKMLSDGSIFTYLISTWTTNVLEEQTNATGFDDNQWHHVGLTYDGSSSSSGLKLYVDGNEEATTVNKNTLSATILNNISVKIGRRTSSSASYFDGLIDEVVIYPFALTADEIKLEFNRRSGLKLGSVSTASDGITADDSAAREFCIPGDTSTCNPPVARWKFDEKRDNTCSATADVCDTSGNGNDGTASGGPTWITGRCQQGACMDFDGTDDELDMVESFSLESPATSNAISVSMWFNPDVIPSSETDEDTLIYNEQVILRLEGSDDIEAFVYDETGDANNINADGFWTTNEWQQIVLTFDNTDMKIYRNGAEVSTTNSFSGQGIGQDQVACADYVVGAGCNAGIEFFNGLIDDVRIYDYARSAAQVAWDYNRGAPIGWWKLDDGQDSATTCDSTTTTVRDASGNSNDGTLTLGASPPAATAWVDGYSNCALDFDGSDDYVARTTGFVTTGTVFTVSLWCNFPNVGQNNPVAYSENTPANWASDLFIIYCGDNEADGAIRVWQNATRLTYGNVADMASSWHHVVVVQSSITNRELFVDGVSRDTNSDSISALAITNAYFGAGNNNGTFTQHYDGIVDDVRIYNYALNKTQVQGLYTNGLRFGPGTGIP